MIKKCTDYLNEKMGVNSDGEILSDFLISFLMKAEPGNTYIFIRPDAPKEPVNEAKSNIPQLIGELQELIKNSPDKVMDFIEKHPEIKKFIKFRSEPEKKPEEKKEPIIINELPKLEKNVYKVYVNYSTRDMGGVQAFFDPSNSKYTKNGYILYFTFLYKPDKDKIWKHYVYHEIHHGIQFMKMGKKKMLFNRKNAKVHLMKNLIKNHPFTDFMQLLYFTINVEQGAIIPEFYGKLKYRKNIKSLDDLKSYFTKRNIYEFRNAYTLSLVDLTKLFAMEIKNPKTGEVVIPKPTQEDLIYFFSALKKIGNEIYSVDNMEELNARLTKGIGLDKDKDMINETELKATIKNYNKYFNKVGKNMLKKIDKTYPLLIDYYTKKFKDKDDKKVQ